MHVSALILPPGTATLVTACVLCSWFWFIPYVFRNYMPQGSIRLISGFLSHHQIERYLSPLQQFVTGNFLPCLWFPGCFQHGGFLCTLHEAFLFQITVYKDFESALQSTWLTYALHLLHPFFISLYHKIFMFFNLCKISGNWKNIFYNIIPQRP